MLFLHQLFWNRVHQIGTSSLVFFSSLSPFEHDCNQLFSAKMDFQFCFPTEIIHPVATRWAGKIDLYKIQKEWREMPSIVVLRWIVSMKHNEKSEWCVEHASKIRYTNHFLFMSPLGYPSRTIQCNRCTAHTHTLAPQYLFWNFVPLSLTVDKSEIFFSFCPRVGIETSYCQDEESKRFYFFSFEKCLFRNGNF